MHVRKSLFANNYLHLCKFLFKTRANLFDKLHRVNSGCLEAGLNETDEILRHNSVIQGFDAGGLQVIGECGKIGKRIKLCSLA